jgi:hypothetical protein
MSWLDVQSVLADPKDRATAIRQTVPIVLMSAAMVYLQRQLEPSIALSLWVIPVMIIFGLPLRFYIVAGWIRRPPTRRQNILRAVTLWSILIGSFLFLYFVVLASR